MFGLGKKRTKYGRFLDKHGIIQEEVANITGLNRDTVSDACSNLGYKPRRSTQTLLAAAARELSGERAKKEDFWPK